jgi:hypothetical protein
MQKSVWGMAFGAFIAAMPVNFAAAQDATVVELYTSQGCSSCPPADEFFGELRQMPGVIALSLHVDYWDYIGWEDTLADPKFTKRQHNYAHAENSKMVYTPQVIVGGVTRAVGTSRSEIIDAVQQMQAQSSAVDLSATRSNGQVDILARASRAFDQRATVYLVQYQPQVRVDIGRGENAGRMVTYYNVVQRWDEADSWSGAAPLKSRVQARGDGEWVVIIQEAGFGRILAAAKVE